MNWGGLATAAGVVGFLVLSFKAAVRADRLRFQGPVRSSQENSTLLDERERSEHLPAEEPFE